MKKIVFSLLVMGLGFGASAQKTEAALHPSQMNNSTEKKESKMNTAAQAEATAEARMTEMRVAVKNLEMRKQAISDDKTLTPEARKAKLDALYKEHDDLSQKLRKESTKN